jgi:hypothetical protein
VATTRSDSKPAGVCATAMAFRPLAAEFALNMLCKWMGHASMETAAIYANALGAEEQRIVARM